MELQHINEDNPTRIFFVTFNNASSSTILFVVIKDKYNYVRTLKKKGWEGKYLNALPSISLNSIRKTMKIELAATSSEIRDMYLKNINLKQA
jgi:hypothetical protein